MEKYVYADQTNIINRKKNKKLAKSLHYEL